LEPKLERNPINRKALQLCAQVADALNLVLASCADDCLRECLIEGVIPAPDSSHMLVTVRTTQNKEQVVAALHKASGMIRSEIATAIHRKKVPQLRFQA